MILCCIIFELIEHKKKNYSIHESPISTNRQIGRFAETAPWYNKEIRKKITSDIPWKLPAGRRRTSRELFRTFAPGVHFLRGKASQNVEIDYHQRAGYSRVTISHESEIKTDPNRLVVSNDRSKTVYTTGGDNQNRVRQSEVWWYDMPVLSCGGTYVSHRVPLGFYGHCVFCAFSSDNQGVNLYMGVSGRWWQARIQNASNFIIRSDDRLSQYQFNNSTASAFTYKCTPYCGFKENLGRCQRSKNPYVMVYSFFFFFLRP